MSMFFVIFIILKSIYLLLIVWPSCTKMHSLVHWNYQLMRRKSSTQTDGHTQVFCSNLGARTHELILRMFVYLYNVNSISHPFNCRQLAMELCISPFFLLHFHPLVSLCVQLFLFQFRYISFVAVCFNILFPSIWVLVSVQCAYSSLWIMASFVDCQLLSNR